MYIEYYFILIEILFFIFVTFNLIQEYIQKSPHIEEVTQRKYNTIPNHILVKIKKYIY